MLKQSNAWKWGTQLLLLAMLLSLVACGRFGNTGGSSVSGTVKIGQGKFLSKTASRMVVAVYASKDFDTRRSIPLADAVPLAKAEVALASPPYKFNLPTTGQPPSEAYVFVFVDQDNSGGDKPNSGDLFGTYRDAIFLNGYALDNVDVDLTGYYGLPDIQVEVKLPAGVALTAKATQLKFGFYKGDDMGANGTPKKGALPVIFYNVVDLQKKNSWTFSVSPGQNSSQVVPFAWLNQTGGNDLANGDLHTTWNKGPIPLEQPYKEKLLLVLSKTYAATP